MEQDPRDDHDPWGMRQVDRQAVGHRGTGVAPATDLVGPSIVLWLVLTYYGMS